MVVGLPHAGKKHQVVTKNSIIKELKSKFIRSALTYDQTPKVVLLFP